MNWTIDWPVFCLIWWQNNYISAPPTPPPTPPIGDPFRISPSVIAQLQRQLEDMKARRDEFAGTVASSAQLCNLCV